MNVKYKHPIGSRRNIGIALILSFLVLVVVLFLYLSHKNNTTGEVGINYAPATKIEKQEAAQNKDRIVKEQETTPAQSSSTVKKVTPIITTAGVYDSTVEVSSYVPSIFEDGGICTATLTLDNQKITKTNTGITNVSSAQCPTFEIPLTELSHGTWSVIVSYSSASAEGTSTVTKLEVN